MDPDRAPASRDDRAAALRALPAVAVLARGAAEDERCRGVPRTIVIDAARRVLTEVRAGLASGAQASEVSPEEILERVAAVVRLDAEPPLGPAINATGIIIHTGLGRAPMAREVAEAIAAVARGYAPVELDLGTGRRGRRTSVVRDLLTRLTGAEDATVVNNNAAALVLTLAALARDREVIVSRGELVEIGGSFRLPDIMETGGARLREVGTTNRTRVLDYEEAIGEATGLLLKVHHSNFRIEGFHEEVAIETLSALGRQRGIPTVHDVGSGALRPLDDVGITGEPDVASSLAGGADLVLFSGDKLLGGPQSGIIVGRGDLVAAIDRHPLMRAMRVDKLVLAGLGATLRLHLDRETAVRDIPVIAMAQPALDTLEQRGTALAARFALVPGVKSAVVEASTAYLGGGAYPARSIESRAVEVRASAMAEEELAHRLRLGRPAIVPRVSHGAVWFDLRTILPEQEDAVVSGVSKALQA